MTFYVLSLIFHVVWNCRGHGGTKLNIIEKGSKLIALLTYLLDPNEPLLKKVQHELPLQVIISPYTINNGGWNEREKED